MNSTYITTDNFELPVPEISMDDPEIGPKSDTEMLVKSETIESEIAVIDINEESPSDYSIALQPYSRTPSLGKEKNRFKVWRNFRHIMLD